MSGMLNAIWLGGPGSNSWCVELVPDQVSLMTNASLRLSKPLSFFA